MSDRYHFTYFTDSGEELSAIPTVSDGGEYVLYSEYMKMEQQLAGMEALLRDAIHRVGDDGFDAIWKKEVMALLKQGGEG